MTIKSKSDLWAGITGASIVAGGLLWIGLAAYEDGARRASVIRSKPSSPTQPQQIEKRERSIEGIVQGESTVGERWDPAYLFSVRGPDIYGGKGETTYLFQVFQDPLKADALISSGMKVKVTYDELQTLNRTDIISIYDRNKIQIQY